MIQYLRQLDGQGIVQNRILTVIKDKVTTDLEKTSNDKDLESLKEMLLAKKMIPADVELEKTSS